MNLNILILYLVTLVSPRTIACEQYTSVDELSRWSQETLKTFGRLDELIREEESILNNLRLVRDSLIPMSHEVKGKQLIDPVQIFIVLNRLYKAMDLISALSNRDPISSISVNDDPEQLSDIETSDSHDEYGAQIHEELRGSGSALLRLQNFYSLNVSYLIAGSVAPGGSKSFKMNADDCFRLGQIAYRDEQYGLAIVWLHASLDLVIQRTQADEQFSKVSSEQLIEDILDHMAFAAYKLKLLDYAIRLTKAWLERDPENERARTNLAYYVDEQESATKEHGKGKNTDTKTSQNLMAEKYYESYKGIALDDYQVENDEVVRRLCRQVEPILTSNRNCLTGPGLYAKGYFFPGLKIETLNENPRIIRIYDVITQHEAEYLQSVSRPRLSRSTIMLSNSQQASNFRIAKTAWLESGTDGVLDRIEDRLSAISGLKMDESEHLQVVNYGLGGFYGPHLDTSRASKMSGNESILVDQLARNDRYATILLYLNDVQIGGSTVFPVLNLSVPPIARSAVVWFNILDNGYADERTLHTGCPVSLGSKWIAVKWPREAANSFNKGRHWWQDSS